MKTVATFGEIMLRLSPPDKERLFQSPGLRAFFGGAEANVAVSLSLFGHETRFISVVPDNDLGDAAVGELRKYGVRTEHIVRQGKRLGIYFVVMGANQRPSEIIYDREHSAIADVGKGAIDWPVALSGMQWLHVTGITPALSRSAAEQTMIAVKTARTRGITVSVDLNYRGKLWKYGMQAPEVMGEIFKCADIGIANEEDCQKSLGIETETALRAGGLDMAIYERLTGKVMEKFPNLKKMAVMLRESRSAEHNIWSGGLRNPTEFIAGPRFAIEDIVDRIGGGDAFAAGLIHGFDVFPSDEKALEFAVAASCLKHSIPGDFNLVTEDETLALMKGDQTGRIKR